MNAFLSFFSWLASLFKKPAPIIAPEIVSPPKPLIPLQPTAPPAPTYLWDTKENIRHSMRMIADLYLMTWLQKDLLCDICSCESGFNIHAKLVNSPKSVDRGLFQWNNYYHPEITDDIAYDPEKTTHLACKAILSGKAMMYWSASSHCWNVGGKYDAIL